MNRWRQRLAELHGQPREQCLVVRSPAVRNVQNAQNHSPQPSFEHSEQIEQPIELPSTPPSEADGLGATWGVVEAERAAIVEYDGGVPGPKALPGSIQTGRLPTSR